MQRMAAPWHTTYNWRAFLKLRLAITRLLSFKSSEVGTLKTMASSVLVYNLIELSALKRPTWNDPSVSSDPSKLSLTFSIGKSTGHGLGWMPNYYPATVTGHSQGLGSNIVWQLQIFRLPSMISSIARLGDEFIPCQDQVVEAAWADDKNWLSFSVWAA